MSKLEAAIQQWENNLLDLGKRNRMIKYPVLQGKRRSQQTLAIAEPGYARIYDLLVRQGKQLTVQQPPVEKFDLRCEGVMRLFERLNCPVVPMQGDLRPAGSFTEYRKILRNMRSKMKLAREEQGINILYLVVGFLDWKQLVSGDEAHKAYFNREEALTSPLLLVPVRLKMSSIRAPYVLEMLDEDVVVNPALDQLFRMEYGLSLPELPDPEAPVDDFLDQVEEMAQKHGWAVRREAQLALVSFQKISMYHDLKRSHDRMARSAVLRAISGEEAYPMDASVMDGVELDAIPPEESHLVVNADSSQHYAVELSRRGVSFCLQGPPGGGKSQTITNIIAQALADGKKVLFVAEKMAALDVVHRRLKDAGLGEFTLALHSHRADRKSILAEIGQPLNLARQELDYKAMATLDELEELRRSLNVYPALLHRRREPLDESLYTVLGELSQLHDTPLLMAQLTAVEKVTRSELTQELTRLERIARAWERYQMLPDNPWQGLQGMWTTFMARTQLNNDAAGALEGAHSLQPVVEAMTAEGLLLRGRELASLMALARVCAAARQAGPVSEAWINEAARATALAAQAKEYAERVREAERLSGTVLLPGAQVDAAAQLTRLTALDADLREVLTGVRWQTETDAFATHYAALVDIARRIHENAQQAVSLLGCTTMTGREADWSLNAVAALAAAPGLNRLPEEQETAPLLEQVKAVRKEAAALLQRAGELLIHWQPSVLQLDAAGMLYRFDKEYAGFGRLTNLNQYMQDMRVLGAYYTGRARLDDTIARSFLSRLADWQKQHQQWSSRAYPVTQALDMAPMGPDGAWDELEDRLGAQLVLARCADTPAHRNLLENLLSQPESCQRAALIQEPVRYADFDVSLRSADFAGDALADDISRTLHGILTAADALAQLRGAVDALRPACTPGASMTAMLNALRQADEKQRSGRLLEETLTAMTPLMGSRAANCADLQALARDAQAIADAMSQAHQLPGDLAAQLLTGVRPLPEIPGGAALTETIARLEGFGARFAPEDSPLAQPFEALCIRLQRCLQEPDALDLWQEWRDTLAGSEGTLLAPVVAAAQKAALPTSQWTEAARRLFLCSWVETVLGEEPLLSFFRAHVHEERISRFGTLDQQQLEIARSRIRKQLIDLTPDEAHRALSATDELAILQRELMKKRGHLPLRKLFTKIPHLLTTLKPCLMMSPLSVASYLESEELVFDLVIFDEASQIMPENAIGAILRGKQVVVTGDTRQMPPTDFFTVSVGTNDYDSEDEDEAEEETIPEESILEQCACVLPSCPLLWHYRSRHESLIAFSNREIYGGRLVTFPGSIDRQPHLGVELVYVPDGLFIRRRNRQEAQKCVELIAGHIRERSHRSLGVVAFSRTQQAAIEEELHRFRIAHPEYDEFFDEGRDEPFFIKNLENVQGDERDTMIFSVGYARREGGKPMSLNLGPLSAAGGERRLNVAITRARYNVKLVTSVLAKDIDPGRTTAEGTRLLRAYIDYAENGYAAIEDDGAVQTAAAPAKDVFAARLKQVLEAAGYQVETGVGCSGCRVDLAVRHPEDESRYALGVMTDGAAYASQRTCRDRDRLQASVLRGMGWRLHRVWAADWLQRPGGVERDLIAAAKAAVEAPLEAPDTEAARNERVWSHPVETPVSAPVDFADYQMALLPENTDLPINELALRVIETEQPVHRDEMCRRLAPALGHDRVDPALRKDVEVAIARMKLDGLQEDNGFLSAGDFTLSHPRRAGHRTIDMIAPEELRLAVFLVAEHSIGASRADVITRVAELLGFERRGPRIQRALENVLDDVIEAGLLRMEGGKLFLVQDEEPVQKELPAPDELPVLPMPEPENALPAPDAFPVLPAAPSPEVTDHD